MLSVFGAAAAMALTCELASGQTTCGQNFGPDVILSDISGVSNTTVLNGIDAVSFGDVHCNLGTAAMAFQHSTTQHPVSGGAVFRLKQVDGASRLEQLGQGWLLHGFFALSSNQCGCGCTPTDGSTLGPGCSDSNTAAITGSQSALGPKWQVNAFTGQFAFPHANPPFTGTVARRIQVHVADLEPTGGPGAARFFAEKVMVAPDEAAIGNGKNNASYRELTALGNNGEWTFGFAAPTQREKPALRAWQDADPSVQIVEVQVPGEGTFLLGWQVTDLGNGRWHYEYALYNVNSDVSAQSFAVPVPANVALFEPGFHDVDYHSGDGIGNVDQSGLDWSLAHAGNSLSWASETFAQNPNANALRWATLYNFRFDADSPPAAGNVTIGLFKQVGSVTAAVDVPAASGSPGAIVCAGDGLDSALTTPCPCANTGTLQHGCANSANAAGARLLSSGTTSPDTVVMTATGELPSVLSALLQGDVDIVAGITFGDGIRCAGGNLKRLFLAHASGGTVVFPGAGNPSISVQSATLGDPIAPGTTRTYQVYYRDPDLAFCASPPGNAWNVTNGSRVVW